MRGQKNKYNDYDTFYQIHAHAITMYVCARFAAMYLVVLAGYVDSKRRSLHPAYHAADLHMCIHVYINIRI